jgi:PAS domain S-box-containing protein
MCSIRWPGRSVSTASCAAWCDHHAGVHDTDRSRSDPQPGDLARLGDDPVEVALVAATDHAVVVADPDGVIHFWNPAAEAMFGHSREDAIGQTLDLIVPEKLRDRHWEGYDRVMRTGETDYGGRTLSVPAMRADGERISVEFTVTLLRDPSGDLRGIGAVLRDVTARWEEQRALNRRLAELEREVASLRGDRET